MDRRQFFKISAISGTSAALAGCGHPEHQLIRFIPEEELIPGIAVWRPGVCTLCSGGCGLTVRVMEGEAEVVRHGQHGLIQMGLAKKLEGNPNHPVNQGRLCARGQAGLQITYNPDRVRNPLRRRGPRGSGQFEEISWDEATKELASKLASIETPEKGITPLSFLTRPLRGARLELIQRFLSALNANGPTTFALFDEAVLRHANALSFGHPQPPTFDLAHANYVLSFGADFLGNWNSPVAQGIAYGEMRQGRPGLRGKFVQVESRMSPTGANADEWVPARPGTEGILALGLAHVIMAGKLAGLHPTGRAGALIAGWSDGLPDYTPEEVAKMTGVSAARISQLASEIVAHRPAVAIIGGAPLAGSNGLFNAVAVNALNSLLGSVEKPGGIFFTPSLPLGHLVPSAAAGGQQAAASGPKVLQPLPEGQSLAAKVLLLYEANVVFATPPGYHVRQALEKVPFIASFGSFVDETSIWADLILPDHSPLESWLDDIPESGTTEATLTLAPPTMNPLHDTRAMPDVLLAVAHQLGGKLAAALPWANFEEMLQATYGRLRETKGSVTATDAEDFWKKIQEQGGWWSSEVKATALPLAASTHPPFQLTEPQFEGREQDYPFHFLPFASQALGDGSLANLPWLQEMPDVLSTAMWGTWVEINPATASRLNIRQSDLVEVASQFGTIQAPALLSPGIAPDVVAMPAGQGHEHYGRYASHRGANPIAVLAPTTEPVTGTLAWATTRVKISRVGEGKLILFSGGMERFPHRDHHR